MAALVVALLLAALVVVALGVAGWYYSGRLKAGGLTVHRSPPEFDLIVRELGEGTVSLAAIEAKGREGLGLKVATAGLDWEGGYGRLGPVRTFDNATVTRPFASLEGTLAVGTPVRLDTFTFPGDPQRGLGLPFEEVMIHGPLGEMPAWSIDAPAPRATGVWAILVHGQNTDRCEVLRQLPAIRDAGCRALLITYRNDEGAPPAFDGNYHYGASEWEDLEAAAGHAIEHGAQSLVLVGQSMGGGIVMSFLLRSPLAEYVRAVVLDSPMLDFRATVRWRAPRVPEPVFRAGMFATGLRFGYDWRELDYLRRASELRVPMLLFHGDADSRVPFGTSESLANARPEIVTLVRMPGVGHVRSWNVDPEAYEAKVREFLAERLAEGGEGRTVAE